MEINRNNYEIFFIDYFDGNLNTEEVADLLLFLEQNFDLKEEFEGLNEVSIPDEENITYDFKDSLKKNVESCPPKITTENYEDYFIASLDGDLLKKDKKELVNFLLKNPELSKEFKLFKNTFLECDTEIEFADKDGLKKIAIQECGEIDSENYEEYFIADLEGDLSLQQKQQLTDFIKNKPNLEKEYELFKNTILFPDESIVFKEKKSLKKFAIPVFSKNSIYSTVSVAASIIIIVAIALFFPRHQISHGKLANRNSITTKSNLIKPASKHEVKINLPTVSVNNIQLAENTQKKIKKTITRRSSNIKIIENIYSENNLASAEKEKIINSENRDYYSNIYNEIQMSQTYRLANAEKAEQDNYLTIGQLGLKKLRAFTNNENTENNPLQFSWVDIANVSVAGFNKLTNSQMKLNIENQQLTAISFADNRFNFSKK